MDQNEIRLRCIEAAAKNPDVRHADGLAAGVLAQAKEWYNWIVEPEGRPAAGKIGIDGLM